MTFLPIADRELRVTSRSAVTYWSRVVAVGLAALAAAGVLLITGLQSRVMPVQPGTILFTVLKWMTFVFVSAAGIFLTADCLSEEKREGTLGLLFLTDLRGYDVVVGKLLATSLRAVYGLLAAFPVLGLSFLLGGVTGGEFGRLVLLLCNTLFFSLALGAWVSSISRESLKALTAAALVSALFFLVLPGLDAAWAALHNATFVARAALASPSLAFISTGAFAAHEFWTSTVATHLMAWVFLVLASRSAPRNWQEKSLSCRATETRSSDRDRQRSVRHDEQRTKLLAENPVDWLAGRERWLWRGTRWFLYGSMGLYVTALGSGLLDAIAASQVAALLLAPAILLFELWVAAQASRFLIEARRNGMLELLLATPVTPEHIISGHARALRRMFVFPTVALLVMLAVAHILQIFALQAALGGTASAANSGVLIHQIVSHVSHLLSFVTSLLALAWFGMWMGLVSQKTSTALIKTFLFVEVLPAVALVFLQGLLMLAAFGTVPRSQMPIWLAPAIAGALGIGVNVIFAVVSRKKVRTGFRNYVAQVGGPVPMKQPPPLPPVSPPRP